MKKTLRTSLGVLLAAASSLLPAHAQQALHVDASGHPTTTLDLSGGHVAGTLAPARLGTGTPSSGTVLRGDGVWAAPAAGGLPSSLTGLVYSTAGAPSQATAAQLSAALTTAMTTVPLGAIIHDGGLSGSDGSGNYFFGNSIYVGDSVSGAGINGPSGAYFNDSGSQGWVTGGTITAGAFSGDGSQLTNLPPPTTDGNGSIGIGVGTIVDNQSVIIGANARASGGSTYGATALGNSAAATTYYATALGYYATASGENSIALGYYATASGENSIALGPYATASGGNSIVLGASAAATDDYATALGCSAAATNDYATALGYYATASGGNSIALGYEANASTNNVMEAGQWNYGARLASVRAHGGTGDVALTLRQSDTALTPSTDTPGYEQDGTLAPGMYSAHLNAAGTSLVIEVNVGGVIKHAVLPLAP